MDTLNAYSAMIALGALSCFALSIAVFSNESARKSAFSVFLGVLFILGGIALLLYGMYLAIFVGW